MTYVVNNEGLIKDPYVLQELQQIQAKLKGLSERVAVLGDGTEKPDQPVPTPKGDPTNPDRTALPTVGVRWITGPWVIGVDGDGYMPQFASYAVQSPAAMSADQHNYALNDSTIILEVYPNAAFNLTGLRQAIRQRRIVGILNRGARTMRLVNQSASSESRNRFEWGTSGDAGDKIDMPPGAIVWVYYDPSTSRWRLFGMPAVGGTSLPPSIVPPSGGFADKYDWFRSRMVSASSGMVAGAGEAGPTVSTNVAAAAGDRYGYRQQCTTGAVSGNTAGVAATAAADSPKVRLEFDEVEWVTLVRTDTDIADVAYRIVLSSAVPTQANFDTGNVYYVGFISWPQSGAAADWLGFSSNLGANVTSTSSLGAVAAGTVYKLKMRWKINDLTLRFSVNDGEEKTITTNIPSLTTDLQWYAYVETRAAVAKTLHWYRHSMRLGGSPPT